MALPVFTDRESLTDNVIFLQTTAITAFIIMFVLMLKATFEKYQQESARSTVVVVGAGKKGYLSRHLLFNVSWNGSYAYYGWV